MFKEGLMGTWFQSISNSREMNHILQTVFEGKKMNEVTEPKYSTRLLIIRFNILFY